MPGDRVVMRKLGSRTPLPEGHESAIEMALFPFCSAIIWSDEVTYKRPAHQVVFFNQEKLLVMASGIQRV